MKRGALALGITLVVVLGVYVPLSVISFGRAWPYPEILPHRFEFRDNGYTSLGTCQSRTSYPHLYRVGTLASALVVGGEPIFTYTRHGDTWNWIVVKDGNCFRDYEGDNQL